MSFVLFAGPITASKAQDHKHLRYTARRHMRTHEQAQFLAPHPNPKIAGILTNTPGAWTHCK